jgi:hypothetical protein
MRFWGPANPDRRSVGRKPADFFAIELSQGGRYLHRIKNISRTGLLMEDPLRVQRPGQIMDLLLPRRDTEPVRVKAQVVRVTKAGHIGLKALGNTRLYGLGGNVEL